MWQITGASIPGSYHTMPGKPAWKNNQDALYMLTTDQYAIGLVADGCGSGKTSEVGAHVGVRVLGEALRKKAERIVTSSHGEEINFETLRQVVLGHVSVTASAMGESLSSIVNDHFLFSLVGFIVLPKTTIVFHCGDGVYQINEEIHVLGPFPKNAPPYISYGLFEKDAPTFTTVTYDTEDIKCIALGTDGTDYICDLEETLGTWFGEDKMFSNQDMLRRKLALMNVEKVENGILSPGPLKDDTTLILVRKSGKERK